MSTQTLKKMSSTSVTGFEDYLSQNKLRALRDSGWQHVRVSLSTEKVSASPAAMLIAEAILSGMRVAQHSAFQIESSDTSGPFQVAANNNWATVKATPETHSEVQNPCGEGFAKLVNRLISLYTTEPDEDEVKPTDYAYMTAWRLVMEATAKMDCNFPKASATVTDEGGIRIRWRSENAEVRLAIPADENGKHYIYFEHGDRFGGETPVTGDKLASLIEWFAARV
jgi:hypothetical protein